MFRYFLLVALIPALVFGQATPVRQCTGGRATPQQVRIAGCTAAPCNVIQGTDAIMHIDFRAASGATTLRPTVFATALGATIEYQLNPQFHPACNHLIGGASCPLSVNEDATYNFVFGVTIFYPPIPVAVELSLVNQSGDTVFCTIIDIHVRIR